MNFRNAGLCGRVIAAALLGASLAGSACEKAAPTSETPAKSDGPVQVYTVKGVVAQLPSTSDRSAMFQVAHENIPGFVDRDGKVVGMNAMTMPFPPSPGVSLDGLSVGDRIELTFEVRWDQIPPQRATAIKKLGTTGG